MFCCASERKDWGEKRQIKTADNFIKFLGNNDVKLFWIIIWANKKTF